MLRTLEDASVQCIVTSPPYYSLRRYPVPDQIFGGDENCPHVWSDERYYDASGPSVASSDAFSESGTTNAERLKASRWRSSGTCQTCGAWRGQLGLEPSVGLYVEHIAEIFRECRRVLSRDGTLWLNLGDGYCQTDKWGGKSGEKNYTSDEANLPQAKRPHEDRIRPKCKLGVPWRVAFALIDDGWILRQDIVWEKPNCMPESAKDRPTTSHEYIFLFSKSRRYYYDADAIKETVTGTSNARGNGVNPKCSGWADGPGSHSTLDHAFPKKSGPNSREHVTRKFGGADPKFKREALGEKMAEAEGEIRGSVSDKFGRGAGWRVKQNESFSAAVAGLVDVRNARSVWRFASEAYKRAHYATFPRELPRRCILAGSRPGDVILDPFVGSGTTIAEALRLGRSAIGIDLDEGNLALIEERILAVTSPLDFEGDA
jgi:DNA modification methylase